MGSISEKGERTKKTRAFCFQARTGASYEFAWARRCPDPQGKGATVKEDGMNDFDVTAAKKAADYLHACNVKGNKDLEAVAA